MKKFCAFLLCLALVMSFIPSVAFAADQSVANASIGRRAIANKPAALSEDGPARIKVSDYVAASVAFTPFDTVISPDGSRLFLTDNASKQLVAIELESGVQQSLSLTYSPKEMTFSEGELLVALSTPEYNSDQLLVVSPVDLTIARTISVSFDIALLAADHDHIYATGNASMFVLDRASGNQTSMLSAGTLNDITINPVNGRLYSAEGAYVSSYDIVDGGLKLVHKINQDSNQLTIMPDGKSIVVNNYAVYSCSPDAVNDLLLITRFDNGSQIAADAALNELYMLDERLITVFDASSFAFKRIICNPLTLTKVLAADGHLVTGGKDNAGNFDFAVMHTGAMLASLTVNGEPFTEFYQLQRIVNRGEVASTVSQVDIAAVPALNGAVVSGDIGIRPLAVGVNTFAIRVNDPSSSRSETYTLKITRRASDPPQPVRNGMYDLGFMPIEMALDPERPVAYMTGVDSKSLFRVDLQTGAIQEKQFDLLAESLTVRNGKIYVALLRGPHTYYPQEGENGFGAVAVVDATTFRIENIINTNVDPYDIEADDSGHVYLAPGSAGWSSMFIYDSVSGRVSSTSYEARMYFGSLIDRNPVTGKIYSITPNVSPRMFNAYEIKDGRVVSSYGMPNHLEYGLFAFQRVSPDGTAIFNGEGNVFASKPTQAGDMVFMEKLPNQFDSLCFDLQGDRFYSGASNSTVVSAYEYKTRAPLGWINLPDPPVIMDFDGQAVVAILMHSDDTFYIERFVPVAPRDLVSAFVTRFYQLFFNRTPDQGGLDYWTNALLNKSTTGASAAAFFVDSNEFRALGVNDSQYLDMMYRAFFDREGDAGGKAYWQGYLDNGMSRYWVLFNFVNSSEFQKICNDFGIIRGSLTLSKPADLYPKITAFVTRFYKLTLERSPDDGGLNYWVKDLADKKRTGAILANDFVFSQEFINRNTTNEQFVTIMYRAFFGREPEAGGMNYWVTTLKNGGTRKQVLAGFVYSNEFQGICNDYGIARGTLPN